MTASDRYHGNGEDREMRCSDCGARMFSSKAADFVAASYRCPRCYGSVYLVQSVPHTYTYPRVMSLPQRNEF